MGRNLKFNGKNLGIDREKNLKFNGKNLKMNGKKWEI